MLAFIMILLNFVTGSFLIVFGVNVMGKTLEHANSRLLDSAMHLFTKNRWTSFLTGIFLTGLVQSGTAVTILTIGFVDSGVMQLESAVSIVYGANIGTTLTAQLMSFNVSQYAWYVLIAGCIMSFGPFKKLRTAGNAFAGVGLMFSGLNILSKSVVFIKGNALIAGWLQNHADNLWLCLFTGLIVTMMVQSSSATVGLTILLFNSGLMPFASAVALTLGDNVGSCITAQIASIKSGTAGKRTAWAHTLYNIIGVFLALMVLPQFCTLVQFFTHLIGEDNSRLVANTHTIFNLLSAVVFLPISKYYVKFLEFIVPEKKRGPLSNPARKARNFGRLPLQARKREHG